MVNQILNGWFGQQLADHFDFVFDRGIELSDQWPRHIRDYFAPSTGPHWLEKWRESTPWFLGAPVDLAALRRQCTPDRFLVPVLPGTNDYRGWTIRHTETKSIDGLRSLGLDYLADLAVSQGFYEIYSVNLNTLYPGGYIGPHIDGYLDNVKKKIYISLDPSDRVHYRFGNWGQVPMDQDRLLWLATDTNVHAVVNDSDQVRRIVSISGYADWPKP